MIRARRARALQTLGVFGEKKLRQRAKPGIAQIRCALAKELEISLLPGAQLGRAGKHLIALLLFEHATAPVLRFNSVTAEEEFARNFEKSTVPQPFAVIE